MTTDQALTCAILVVTLVLFIWGRWRYDVVALMAMIAVVVAGLVPADRALLGFGHPAVITVAAVLVVSRALRNAGIVDVIAAGLAPLTTHAWSQVAVLTGAVALCSAFMNNVGALALLLPVALASAESRERPASLILMPLAFGSILGGLLTMIGTPPNIIIAAYRADLTGEAFGMFDFTPVGIVVAVVGVAFVALIGWRLLPGDRNGDRGLGRYEIDEYILELRVADDSPLKGKRLADVEGLGDEVVPVALVHGGKRVTHPSRWRALSAGDVLVVKADPAALESILGDQGLSIVGEANDREANGEDDTDTDDDGEKKLRASDLELVETIVTPDSRLASRPAAALRRFTAGTVSLLALARQGRPIRSRLTDQRFEVGDVLLLQGDSDALAETLNELGLLPLAGRDLKLGHPRRVLTAIAVFAAAIVAAVTGALPIAIAFIAAIVAYVLLGLLPVRELYRDIDWPVIVLLGAMISVGQAMEITGAALLVAETIIALTSGFGPVIVLALVMILTMTLSDVINNAATALIMAPIAVGIAHGLGVAMDPFLMAVAVGASCAFLTPIGHQSNTLVMGPGGYRFGDYWRMGLPLELIIVAVSVPMIMVVWPF